MKPRLRLLTVIAITIAAVLAWSWLAADRATWTVTPAASATPPAPLPSEPRPAIAPTPGPEEVRRAALPTPAPEPPAPPAVATVRVRVEEAETQRPLAGRRIVAIVEPPPTSWSAQNADGPRAAIGEMALSDAAGRVELEVEPGRQHRVLDMAAPQVPATVVDALAPGATADVVLRIPDLADASFFGRVVDAATRLPIAGATYRIDDAMARGAPTGPAGTVDVDGVFELRYRSWADRFARLAAPGFAWAVAPLGKDHATRDRALEVPLERAAVLEVVVRDGPLPLAAARARASTEGYRMSIARDLGSFYFGGHPEWRGTSGADGLARLEDVAPKVPLQLVVAAGDRSKSLAEPIQLEPGETRRVEVRFGAGATIRGLVETSRGEPLADVAVSRVVARAQVRTLLEPYYEAAATTRTDANGRFAFDDVGPGSWWVGVAPSRRGRRDAPAPPVPELAPLAEVVTITADDTLCSVIVRTDAGLYVSGHVFDSDRMPAPGMVEAVAADGAWIRAHTDAGADGAFRAGPLPAGSYRVRANPTPRDGDTRLYCASAAVVAAAGAGDLELRLRPGTGIGVTLRGPDGDPIDAEIKLDSRAQEFGFTMTSTHDGHGRFDGLAPGTYRLSAATSSGLFATRAGIVARAGEPPSAIDLLLQPGAILELTYDGPRQVGSYGVYVDGDCVDANGVEKGAVGRLVAPAGAVEVRSFAREGEATEVHRLTLQPGETRQLVVGR